MRGRNHGSLTLDELAALADLLGLRPTDLLAAEQHRAEREDDEIVLEAALGLVSKSIQLADLARALNWTTERTHVALSNLRSRLSGTGTRLHRHASRYRLVPEVGVLTAGERQRLENVSVTRARLTLPEARVLRAVIFDRVDDRWLQAASNAQQAAAAKLLRLGWATHRDGRLLAAPAVGHGLGLDRRVAKRHLPEPVTLSFGNPQKLKPKGLK